MAEKIRRQRPSEGERRTVTVLFADAVESTPLAEKLGEEGMYGLMRECLSHMAEAVHAYEGHVAAFTGDGLMALFGAPIAHEDSARRGVAAALRMQSALDGSAAEVEARHGVACRFRVGLNTGPVVVGTVTDDLQMDFTAIGDTVNLGSRLEQAAPPGAVLVSDETRRAAADFFDWEPVGELTVKGKAAPVTAWRAVAERGVRTRFEAAAQRGLSPLVGREAELSALMDHVERARDGAGGVVFVSGEPGIGKSRLVFELRRRLAGQGAGWWEGHCVSYARNSPYLPVVDVVKSAFGVTEDDDEDRIIALVDEVVAGWDQVAQDQAPYLKFLLAVDPGDPAVLTLDPQERRVEVFDALGVLLTEESRRRPLIVVVEDLHWADQMSLEALAALVPVVSTLPVLLLLNHRLDYQRPAGEFTALELRPLDDAESVALTLGVFGVDALPPQVQRLVMAKAEGNPFYIEEVSRALVEAGVLTPADGGYRLARPIEEVHIPGTVQEVILSRLDRLDREAKEAMQLASVVGREFTERVLARISDLPDDLSGVLGDLTALELIFEKTRFPELAYMFKHALIHDVAYATLLAERRRAMHRSVGRAIEELYADRLGEHYETLAHHFSEAHDWEKALDYLEKAGDKAAAAYANDDALQFFGRAIEVCDILGEQWRPSVASLSAKRASVNLVIGDVPGCIADFDVMAAMARHLDNRSMEGLALAYRALMEAFSAQFAAAEATLDVAGRMVDEGLEDIRPLLNLASAYFFTFSNRLPEAFPFLASQPQTPFPDPFTEGAWNWAVAAFAYWRGQSDEALSVLRALPDAAARLVFNRLFNWWWEGMALGQKGACEAALRVLRQALDRSEHVGDTLVRPRLLNTIGWVYAELEDPEQALYWNQGSVDFIASVEGFPHPDVEPHARVNLGDNLVALGRSGEAEEQYRMTEAVVTSPNPRDRWMAWRVSQHLFHSYGQLWLTRGDLERASRYADRCLELALYNDSIKNVVKARRLRGQICVAEGDFQQAEAELGMAIDVATELGTPPQLWKTYAAIGDLRRAQGRAGDAQARYGEALAVIEGIAAGLRDDRLRETFLDSSAIARVRQAAACAD